MLADRAAERVRADRRQRRLDRRDHGDPARARLGRARAAVRARAQPGQGRGRPDGADSTRAASSRRSSTPISSTTPTISALLMPPLMDGRANASFGVRAFDGYTSHSFLFVLGNKGVTLACNVLFNVYLHDIMTCHKMIRTDLFQSLPLTARPGSRSSPRSPRGWSSVGERIFEVPGPLPRAGHRRGQEAHRRRRLPRDRDAAALPVRLRAVERRPCPRGRRGAGPDLRRRL